MIDCGNFSVHDVIAHGLSTFMAISTKHFEVLATELGFAVPYTSDVRSIAKEFSERALPCIGISTLTNTVPHQFYDEEGLIIAWQNVFTELQGIDLASDICNWIIKLKDEETRFGLRVSSIEWSALLLDWAINPTTFPPMLLPQKILQEIRIVVMKQRLKEVEIHFRFPRIKEEIENDEWEEYVIQKRSYGAWMRNRIRLYQDLNKWVDIFRLMSKDEIESLDKWGYEIIKGKHNDYTYFPLRDLAKDLQKSGYY